MPTDRKDVYSEMPDSPKFGGFGAIEREPVMTMSPKRSENPRRKRKRRNEKYLGKMSDQQESMLAKSLDRVIAKRFNEMDDATIDALFPFGDEDEIDNFVSELDEKWLLEGATAIVRRALKGRGRRRRRKAEHDDDEMPSNMEVKGAYTKPELRESIKKRIMAGSRGGKPGQWSARKAQLVAQAYKKAGGGYKGKKSGKQRSLSKWSKEDWTTSDGKPAIRKGGTTRYLPKKAWSKLSSAEKAATNRKKREGSRKGRQFIANTDAARSASRSVRKKTGAPYSYETKASPCWQGYVQVGMKKGKNGKMVPNCVPEAEAKYLLAIMEQKAAKQRLRDPKGGLTAAGRAHFKRTEGANLKPGVKGAADTPEKMRRKGSFLTRFFTNPSGPMVGENGKPTRLALSAAAWGEPVPKNRSDAAKLAAKGRRLLERYQNTKKKKK
jgi:hypothetical protein